MTQRTGFTFERQTHVQIYLDDSGRVGAISEEGKDIAFEQADHFAARYKAGLYGDFREMADEAAEALATQMGYWKKG